VEYLRARLDEERWLAEHLQAKRPSPWNFDPETGNVHAGNGELVAIARGGVPADYIATWSPARVLADIEAKRRIVDRFVALLEYAARPYDKPEHAAKRQPYLNALEVVIRDLVQPYSSRPDFNEDWRTP
jgi:hypothetical protein